MIPRTRGECVGAARPCEWTSCRFHLLREIKPAKLARVRVVETCSLDVADREGSTLEQVAQVLGLTREGVRQIETKAMVKIRRRNPQVYDFLRALEEARDSREVTS